MRHGASPEAMSDDLGTALHVAAIRDNLEAVKMLLKAGFEADTVSGKDSQTALHNCVRNSCKVVTQLLLQYRANVDARDGKDIPVWQRGIQAERADILEMLLQKVRHSLDLEGTYTRVKTTGLQIAALRDNPAIVAVLLKMGANPTNKGPNGHDPLALTKNEEVRAFLLKAAEAWDSQLPMTVKQG
jgi:ankyrin repeat protein